MKQILLFLLLGTTVCSGQMNPEDIKKAILNGYIPGQAILYNSIPANKIIGGTGGVGGTDLTGVNNSINNLSSLVGIQKIRIDSSAAVTATLNTNLVNLSALVATKQNVLVSGTNIKTINGTPILGSGDLVITGSGGSTPIANNLTTTTTGSALDATQGKTLKGLIDANTANITTNTNNIASLSTTVGNKQDALVSGSNIKTINGTPIVGAGNISITGGSSGTYVSNALKVYNAVIDFGADTTFTNDATVAIQNTLNAAAANSGVAVIPKGHYKLAGAPKTTDGNGHSVNNAQLYIPYNGYSSPSTQGHLKILGEISGNRVTDFIDGLAPSMKGVILESTLPASTTANIIGTAYSNVSWGSFNYCQATIENITVRANTKSGSTDVANNMSGIRGGFLALLDVKGVRVDVNSTQANIVQPITGVGIETPNINNFCLTKLDNVTILGYYKGATFSEHFTGNDIYCSTCYYGIEAQQMNHSAYIGRYLGQWNKYDILISGSSYFKISEFDSESEIGSAVSGKQDKWFNSTNNIVEPTFTNSLADITFHRVNSYIGPANASFTANYSSPGLFIHGIGSSTAFASTGGGGTGGGTSFPTSGLLAYWNFDQTSGNFTDGTSNGKDLTRNNGVTTSTGKVGNAATFASASNQNLTGSASGLSANQGLTIAGWFKINAVSNLFQTLVVKGSGSTREYAIYYDKNSGVIDFTTNSGGTTNDLSISYTPNGSWIFIVAKWDGTTKSLKINNGTPVTNSCSAINSNLAGVFTVGGSSGDFLDGQADELGIWNLAITSSDDTYLYNSGSGRTKNSMEGFMLFVLLNILMHQILKRKAYASTRSNTRY